MGSLHQQVVHCQFIYVPALVGTLHWVAAVIVEAPLAQQLGTFA